MREVRHSTSGTTILLLLLWCCLGGCGEDSITNPAEAECIDYGDYLHWVGSLDTPGSAYGVTVSGTHAYVADFEAGLQVLPVQCD